MSIPSESRFMDPARETLARARYKLEAENRRMEEEIARRKNVMEAGLPSPDAFLFLLQHGDYRRRNHTRQNMNK